jgi:hypothetical protein
VENIIYIWLPRLLVLTLLIAAVVMSIGSIISFTG